MRANGEAFPVRYLDVMIRTVLEKAVSLAPPPSRLPACLRAPPPAAPPPATASQARTSAPVTRPLVGPFIVPPTLPKAAVASASASSQCIGSGSVHESSSGSRPAHGSLASLKPHNEKNQAAGVGAVTGSWCFPGLALDQDTLRRLASLPDMQVGTDNHSTIRFPLKALTSLKNPRKRLT